MLVVLLEEEEVVGGGHGDDVLLRVPGCVKNLLVEIQTVYRDFIFLPLSTGTHLSWLEHSLWFCDLSGRFQGDFFS